jgi:CBS domain-containing protein
MSEPSQILTSHAPAEDSKEYTEIPPGDRLRALTVRQIMTREVVTARPTWSLLQATQTMREKHISGLPVVDENEHVVGVLSERDVLADLDRAVGVGSVRGFLDLLLELEDRPGVHRLDGCLRRLERARVSEAMTRRVVTVDPDASMGEAARLLRVFSVKRMPVLEDKRLIGILTRQNIVDALA